MKNRIIIKLAAIALSLAMCGCTTLSDVSPVTQTTAASGTSGNTSSETSETQSDVTEINGITYDPNTGEIKSNNSDLYSLVDGEAKSTIDDEYKEGVPEDVGSALDTQLATDHDKLWDVEGEPAFYIPDYHSAKAEDLKNFVLIELCDDGESVIYSYETAYYGDVSKPLNGTPRMGTAKKNHKHVNWNVPDKEKNNADYKPSTNWEVYCFMKYNTVTRAYHIYDVRLGLIDASSESDSSSDVSDEALVNTLKEYNPSNRRMFAGKAKDRFKRFTGGYLYYSMYDMRYTLMDEKGNILRQMDASSLVSQGIDNYVKQNIIKPCAEKHNKNLEEYYKDCHISYSIAKCLITVVGSFMMEMNVTVQMPDEKETEPYSIFCNYAMFSNKSSSEDALLISENQSLVNQNTSETNDKSSSSDKGNKSTAPKMGTFYLKDAPNQKLFAIRLTGADIFDSKKNDNADKNVGYLNTLLKRYMELYKENADEATLDKLWEQAYSDLSGYLWLQKVQRTDSEAAKSTRIQEGGYVRDAEKKYYSVIMSAVARPAAVTGNNLEYILNQQSKNGNIRFCFVDTSEATVQAQNGVSLSLYRSGNTNLELVAYNYAESDSSSGSEDEAENASSENASSENTSSEKADEGSGSGAESDDDSEPVLQSVTIKINDGGNSADSFDVMGAASDLGIAQSDEGNIIYYWERTSGDEKNTTKIQMPFSVATTGKGGGETVILDLAGQVSVLQDQSAVGNDGWVVSALGDEGVWILRCISGSFGGDKDFYFWKTTFSIPYMMTVTPANEIGETTIMTYKDTDDKTVTREVGQKAALTGRNAIDYEYIKGSEYGKYRFTTLQSGILVYDPSSKTTVVADSGQYYGSWKMSDGSYTAIGFKTRVQDAGFEDIMKAKIYHGLKPSEEDQFLLTLKERLKVDKDLQKRFLEEPDGWKKVCKEYNFNPDRFPKKKIETYAKKLIAINKAYSEALNKFWTIVKFIPTAEQKEKIESQFYYCASEEAMDRLITSSMEEYLKIDDKKQTETEAATSESTTKILDDGWIYKVKESQNKALEKKAKQEYIRSITGSTEDEEWQKTLEELYAAAKNKRSMWDN